MADLRAGGAAWVGRAAANGFTIAFCGDFNTGDLPDAAVEPAAEVAAAVVTTGAGFVSGFLLVV